MLTVERNQFVRLLSSGQTKPALVVVDGASWVLRYPRGNDKQLRLASEYMGYRAAAWLDVSVPGFSLAHIPASFHADRSTVIPAGLGIATQWIDGGCSPDLEHQALAPFWEQEPYLQATAAARVADTWIMNYDRRKLGNVIICGTPTPHRCTFWISIKRSSAQASAVTVHIGSAGFQG